MKKQILTLAIVAGFACGAFAQGTVAFDNLNNTSVNPAAATGGVIFKTVSGNPVFDNVSDYNLTLLGGSSAGTMSVVASIFGAAASGDNFGSGLFYASGNSFAVSGVALGGTGTFQIEVWLGSATSYAAASAIAGTYVGISSVFTSATGGLVVGNNPPTAPVEMDAMPSIVLNPVVVPEPTTLALAGLGGFGMLMALRRKQA